MAHVLFSFLNIPKKNEEEEKLVGGTKMIIIKYPAIFWAMSNISDNTDIFLQPTSSTKNVSKFNFFGIGEVFNCGHFAILTFIEKHFPHSTQILSVFFLLLSTISLSLYSFLFFSFPLLTCSSISQIYKFTDESKRKLSNVLHNRLFKKKEWKEINILKTNLCFR